jgi:hypothetical protein
MDDLMNAGIELAANLIDIQGTWQREGRILDGGDWEEPSEVVWMQVGRHFCDLRTVRPGAEPASVLDQAQSFSGTVLVKDGAISFHHDLDSLDRDPSHPDQGTVHRVGTAMLERGPGFEERWVMASLPGDETAVLERSGPDAAAVVARAVRIGSSTLAVWGGSSGGGALLRQLGNWVVTRGALPDPDHLDLMLALAALSSGDTMPAGWLVVEPEEL